MKKDKFTEDKIRVLGWMKKYAHGYKCARTRENILPFLMGISDRYFRLLASELIHEGNLCSSHKRGYWFPPLHTSDKHEIEAFKECQIERKGKALDLITDCDRLIVQAENMLEVATQGQKELVM